MGSSGALFLGRQVLTRSTLASGRSLTSCVLEEECAAWFAGGACGVTAKAEASSKKQKMMSVLTLELPGCLCVQCGLGGCARRDERCRQRRSAAGSSPRRPCSRGRVAPPGRRRHKKCARLAPGASARPPRQRRARPCARPRAAQCQQAAPKSARYALALVRSARSRAVTVTADSSALSLLVHRTTVTAGALRGALQKLSFEAVLLHRRATAHHPSSRSASFHRQPGARSPQ